jgi:hypothetical protein
MSARGLIRGALAHARANVVAYAALFVAVGGTSYAALNLPANSVGARQIRNGSIQPVKLDHSLIAASIRAWVIVEAGSNSAAASAASSPVHVSLVGDGESIAWSHRRFGRNCMASVTPQMTPATGPFGSVTVQFNPVAGNLVIYGFGPDKLGRPQSAYVMIVCP